MAVYRIKVHSISEPNEFVVSAQNRNRAENAVKQKICSMIQSTILNSSDVFSLSDNIQKISIGNQEETPVIVEQTSIIDPTKAPF